MEQDTAPAWVMRLKFAEAFGIAPHEVGRAPLVWWYRWTTWLQTQEARNAFERMKVTENWAEKSTAAERRAMIWAARDDEQRS